jgi:acyl-CoA thioesterase-1
MIKPRKSLAVSNNRMESRAARRRAFVLRAGRTGAFAAMLAMMTPFQAVISQTTSATTGSNGGAAGARGPASQSPALLVLGDSLSAEYGLVRGTGWVPLLAKRLKDDKLDYQVVNASVSGETTSGGVSRLPALLTQYKPRVVIVELGSNDALRGLALEMTEKNLRTLVGSAKKTGARVLLVGMQIPPNYGRDYTQRFKQLFPEIASEQKVPLVPFLLEGMADKIDLFQADHLHPIAQAQPQLLDNVWSKLEPLVRGR